MTGTTIQQTWPTWRELCSSIKALRDAQTEIEENVCLYREFLDAGVAPSLRGGAPSPTREDIGNLTALITHLDLDLSVIQGSIEELKALRDAAAFEIQVAGPAEGEDDA